MRHVQGYVFIVDFAISKAIFGANKGKDGRKYHLIEHNDVTPYVTLLEAIRGGIDLKERLLESKRKTCEGKRVDNTNIKDVLISQLEMRIIEDESEMGLLKEEATLVAIKKSGSMNLTIYGELSPESSRYKSGSPLYYNDLKPFFSEEGVSAFEKASRFIGEMRKKEKVPSKIITNMATFNLKLL